MRHRASVRRSREGVALIIVLGCVVFISILLVALMGSLKTEMQVSNAYAKNNAATILGNTAVNVVMTQIRQATTETAGTAWASQPGMIRTFDTTGTLVKAYKLYSSSKMIDTKADPTAEVTALANWSTRPALFTDLNQPVSGVFPILAPPTNAPTGYSLTPPPGVTAATGSHPLPMPAQWLYMLKDGALVSPTLGAGNNAIVLGETDANPIVGRIAFWTDDETCKVNINTASEGTFWDTPRVWGQTEQNLALYQPQNGEYQSYPGHPAGVSLSTIFPGLGISTPSNATNLYSVTPRVSVGGSLNGTVTPTLGAGALPLKTDRLYATVDEFLFAMNRTAQPTSATFDQTTIGQANFFLTAHSRAPEVTLFGTPRISIWPVSADLDPITKPNSLYTTAYDLLTAFCSQVGRAPTGLKEPYRYYFQRWDADSPTSDYANIQRNKDLYGYLQNYTSQAIPGFSGDFKTKYGDDRDQILTEIFDYIRCTNLFDDNLGGGPTGNGVYTGTTAPTSFYQFTDPRKSTNGTMWPGSGQVTPIQITGPATGSKATMGFGRFFTLSEVGVHVICTADGNGISESTNGAANDYKTVSNLATAKSLPDSSGALVSCPANPTLADTYGGTKTALIAGQQRLQAALLFQIACPMQGWVGINPNFQIKVSGLDKISIAGKTGLFPATASSTSLTSPVYSASTPYLTPYGGNGGYLYAITHWGSSGSTRLSGWSNPGSTDCYPFISNPFTVTSGAALDLKTTSPVTVEIYAVTTAGATVLAQTYQVAFPTTNTSNPASSVTVPDLLQWGATYTQGTGSGVSSTADQWWGYDFRISQAGKSAGAAGRPDAGCVFRADPSTSLTTPWTLATSSTGWGSKNIDGTTPKGDVLRTLVPLHGDSRLIASTPSVDSSTVFETCPNYGATIKLAHDFVTGTGTTVAPLFNQASTLVSGVTTYSQNGPDVPGDVSAYSSTGDWDNGIAATGDGAYINKPDEGNISTASGTGTYPYFATNNRNYASGGATFFTPNRILPSPGMFGSLPTGVKAHVPWKTLLFRPQPTHPSSGVTPKDHLIMDLFDMPVVQPYAISEPLSTAGKINMNYQILPYTYITRNTGICAALKAEKISAIPSTNAVAQYYKNATTGSTLASTRWGLNLSETNGTLRQFKARFDSGDIFRSATEICDIYLVPSNQTWTADSDATTFWSNNRLTGDNTRERPYTDLYARLTTKSNSYTVHYRTQTLQKVPGSTLTQWREGTDLVTGEARGSTQIERFVDPNDTTLPDYATDFTAASLETHYKFRIVGSNTFNP